MIKHPLLMQTLNDYLTAPAINPAKASDLCQKLTLAHDEMFIALIVLDPAFAEFRQVLFNQPFAVRCKPYQPLHHRTVDVIITPFGCFLDYDNAVIESKAVMNKLKPTVSEYQHVCTTDQLFSMVSPSFLHRFYHVRPSKANPKPQTPSLACPALYSLSRKSPERYELTAMLNHLENISTPRMLILSRFDAWKLPTLDLLRTIVTSTDQEFLAHLWVETIKRPAHTDFIFENILPNCSLLVTPLGVMQKSMASGTPIYSFVLDPRQSYYEHGMPVGVAITITQAQKFVVLSMDSAEQAQYSSLWD